MRNIYLKKDFIAPYKLFDLDGAFAIHIVFHSLPRIPGINMPTSVICTGNDHCNICMLHDKLIKNNKYSVIRDRLMSRFQSKCNLNPWNQFIVPVGEYNFNSNLFVYGIMRLWPQSVKVFLDFLIGNDLLWVGDRNRMELVDIGTDRGGNINRIGLNTFQVHVPVNGADTHNFLDELRTIRSTIYSSMGIETEHHAIQAISFSLLDVFKDLTS